LAADVLRNGVRQPLVVVMQQDGVTYLESQKSKIRDPVSWLFQALKQEYDAPLPKPKPTIVQPPPLPPLPEMSGEPLSPEFQALLDRIHKRTADKEKKGEDG
jgi:hypothetical protein